MKERKAPETLEEAYGLRDASETPDEWDTYQEHVYRLRAEEYRRRNIDTKRSVRLRERRRSHESRAETRGQQTPLKMHATPGGSGC